MNTQPTLASIKAKALAHHNALKGVNATFDAKPSVNTFNTTTKAYNASEKACVWSFANTDTKIKRGNV